VRQQFTDRHASSPILVAFVESAAQVAVREFHRNEQTASRDPVSLCRQEKWVAQLLQEFERLQLALGFLRIHWLEQSLDRYGNAARSIAAVNLRKAADADSLDEAISLPALNN